MCYMMDSNYLLAHLWSYIINELAIRFFSEYLVVYSESFW